MFGKEKRQQIERLRQKFGKKPDQREVNYDDVSIYFNITKNDSEENIVDDVTWNDLEMDAVFERMNYTNCYIGEQKLYKQLHCLQQENLEDRALDGLVQYFSEHEEERLEMAYELRSIGKRHESYHLPKFLFHAEAMAVGQVWIFRVLQVLLFGSLFLGILYHSNLCYGIALCTAMINLGIYALNKITYESLLFSLLNTKYMVSFAKKVSKKEKYRQHLGADRVDTAIKELNQLTYMIGNYQYKKRYMWTAEILDLVRDYLIGMTLWDLTAFRRITKIIHGKLGYLLELYEYIGQIDLAISIVSFRASLPFYCEPKWTEQKELKMKKLYHPLVDQPVSNDLMLERHCMITGSNASGKSTFIKAVAVNAILAQSIHTCMAEAYRMPVMRVMTSMTVRDDILSGESYYMRELNYLKRMVDVVSSDRVTLCIIDEILRGTNTQERLAASEAALNYLAEKNCIVIVATHDMELAESLEGRYHCMHFGNYFEDGKIVFDYKIKNGYSRAQNAIKLLEVMGFPKSIVERAECCKKEK